MSDLKQFSMPPVDETKNRAAEKDTVARLRINTNDKEWQGTRRRPATGRN
jgi:hypothetical protein